MKTLLILAAFLAAGHLYAQNENQESPTQTVKGYVLDFQTQQPIVGATVGILELKKGAKTKSDGSFNIPKVAIGRYTLRITSLSYEPFIQNIVLTSGKEIVVNAQLTPSYSTTDELVVTAQKSNFESLNESAIVSSNLFTVDDLERYAGARSDPARMAQNFAGVVSGNDQRNDIIIRGGSPLELLWRLDGLDIPNPNHFATQGATGGPISALNSRILDNSDFLTGAFPAEYGDRMSGVFDLKTRRGNRDKWEYMGQFGFNGLEAGVEGPVSENSSMMLNYRYSFLDLMVKMGIEFGFSGIPRYSDLNFKYDWDITPEDKLSITTLYATSDIDIKESETDEVYTGDFDIKNGTDMMAVILSWQHLFNKEMYGKLFIGGVLSQYRTYMDSVTTMQGTNNVQSLTPWLNNKSQENYETIKYVLNYTPNSKNYITAGVEARYRNYTLNKERYTTGWDSNELFKVDQEGSSIHTLSYINWNWRINELLTINTGLHSQYLQINNQTTIEPRLGLRYNIANGQNLNIGVGVHRQSPPLVIFFADGIKQNLDFMQSIHYVGGYSIVIDEYSMLKAELYYKDISKAPIEANDSTSWSLLNSGTGYGSIEDNISAVSNGTGRAYGAELTFKRNFAAGWYLTATASYIRQQYKGSDGILRWGGFDNQFVCNLLAGYELKVSDDFTMEFSAKAVVAGGNPIIPVDIAKSQQRNNTFLDWERAFSERNEIYNKIDFRIDFRQNFQGYSIISFFSIENILNQQNVLFRQWDVQKQEVTYAYQLGFFPIGGFRIEF